MSQRSLIKWQLISLISKFISMFAGLFQSIVIARILSVSELGLRDIAKGVGRSLGIFQHFGLASASTREISIAQDEKGIFKVFATSLLIRYCLTLPIGVGLFLLAPYISNTYYSIPQLLIPIRVYALVILIEGSQGVLNAVVTGMKRFKNLFMFQSGISLLSLFIYIPLVYLYRVNGFFYAMFIHNVIWTLVLGYVALLPLRGNFVKPSRQELLYVFKSIFSISFAIYIAKILYTLWENFGNNYLGRVVDLQLVGYFTFAAFFAKKIMDVSDAVTDVNLPMMSESYAQNIEEFKINYQRNFDKIFAFILLSATAATFWAPEIIDLAIGAGKFAGSFPLVLPLIVAFVLYAFINIVNSSVFIPAKLVKEMIFGYALLLVGSIIFFVLTHTFMNIILSMAISLAFGALLSFVYIVLISQKRLSFVYVRFAHVLLGIQALVICSLNTSSIWWFKAIIFLPIYGLLVWAIFISKLVTKDEVLKLLRLVKDRNAQVR